MSTRIQKQSSTQLKRHLKDSKNGGKHPVPDRNLRHMLQLQHTIGNLSIQRLLQSKAEAPETRLSDNLSRIHGTADMGISGSVTELPHLGIIQQSFGRHQITGVQAHLDGAAVRANEALGATAYTTGNHVAFSGSPDLHTAAHEAAHVVQQRAGVSLKDGLGEIGDSYEQQADQVAEAVVQGRSAEGILDSIPGIRQNPTLQKKPSKKIQEKESRDVQMNNQRYRPPSGTPPRFPPDARIVDVDTSGLYGAVRGLNWAAAGNEPTWSGWAILRRVCSAAYWRGGSRLTDGVSIPLSYSTNWIDNTYMLSITPRLTNCPSSTVSGGAYAEHGAGGTSVSGSESGTSGLSVSGEAGIEQNAAEGTPSASGSVTMGGQTSVTRGIGVSDVASTQQGTSAATSVRFDGTITWDIRLVMELGASTFGTIITLGGGEIGSELAEQGPQNERVSGRTVSFTLPPERCRPEGS